MAGSRSIPSNYPHTRLHVDERQIRNCYPTRRQISTHSPCAVKQPVDQPSNRTEKVSKKYDFQRKTSKLPYPSDDTLSKDRNVKNQRKNSVAVVTRKENQSQVGLHAMKFRNDLETKSGSSRLRREQNNGPRSPNDSSFASSASSVSDSEESEHDRSKNDDADDENESDGSSDESSHSNSDSDSDGTASPARPNRPRKRPSCNGIVRRTKGKKPRLIPRLPRPESSFTVSNPTRSPKVVNRSEQLRRMTTPTSVAVVGRRGATIGEALIELNRRAPAKRGRGRPSKVVLQERKRVENFRASLQREMRELSSSSSRTYDRKQNREENRDEDYSEYSSSESTQKTEDVNNDSPRDVDSREHRAYDSDTGPQLRTRAKKSSSSNEYKDSETKSEELQVRQQSPMEICSTKGGVGSEAKIPVSTINRSEKRGSSISKDGKSFSSLSDQFGTKGPPISLKKDQTSLKKKLDYDTNEIEQESNIPPPAAKKKRGRPPSSKKKTLKSDKKVTFSDVGKSKRLSPQPSILGTTPSRRKASPTNLQESGDSEDDSRTNSEADQIGKIRQLRESTRRKTSKSVDQDEEDLSMKDRIIASLRAELDITKEKLEFESTRAQELDEALGLTSKSGDRYLLKYDELCNRVSDLESTVAEQRRQLTQCDDTIREKEAAMKGFLEQIRNLERGIEKEDVASNLNDIDPDQANTHEVVPDLDQLAKLKAELENKNSELGRLQSVIDSKQNTLRNVLVANKNLQRKVVRLNGGIDIITEKVTE